MVEELARMTDALGREVNLEILQVKHASDTQTAMNDREKPLFVVLAGSTALSYTK